MFIRHALVAGEWTGRHAFVARNRGVVDEVLALEARLRRGDLLIGDEDLVAWFDSRLPADITDTRRFDRWWKHTSRRQPDLLDLRIDDLIRPDTAPIDTTGFPDEWPYLDLVLPVSYEHDPDSHLDGMNVDVPLDALPRIEAAPFDWLVPSLRRPLLLALLKSLPKATRQQVMPLQETADTLLDRLDPTAGPLTDVVAAELRRRGVHVPAGALDRQALPAHLRPTFRIVDRLGVIIADGHDLDVLRELLADDMRQSLSRATNGIEREGLTSWTIGDLPRVIETTDGGHRVRSYPALVDDGESVSVQVFATPDDQADAMWAAPGAFCSCTGPRCRGRSGPW